MFVITTKLTIQIALNDRGAGRLIALARAQVFQPEAYGRTGSGASGPAKTGGARFRASTRLSGNERF
jgi:hypothetical protein